MLRKINTTIFSFLLAICVAKNTFGYNDVITHPDITERATVQFSRTEQYLTQNLGLTDGLKTQFAFNNQKMNIKQWLREGSTAEDNPMCRASNHFHNPLLSWDRSYMSDEPWLITWRCYNRGFTPRYSNITWATGYEIKGGDIVDRNKQEMGWDHARAYYYTALTSVSKTGRETYFAKTFQALGHVMHLLEDISVPAHARNDFTSHLTHNGLFFTWFYQPYERYVKNNPLIVQTAVSEPPDFSNAAMLITDFWDTDQYIGNNPSTSLSLGLAEFTNANYFSDSTIPTNNPTTEHIFPNPTIGNVTYQICEDYEPVYNQKKRWYISRKNKQGCDHFAVVSALNPMIYFTDVTYLNNNISSLKLFLDNNVHNTYAKELIPRAVGYSAGLLNYFFRGTLEISLPEKFVYSIIDGSITPQQFTYIKAKVRNTTSGEEIQNCDEVKQNCLIQAVAKYKVRPDYRDDLSNDPPTEAEMKGIKFSYSVSKPVVITSLSSTAAREFSFDFTNDPIPVGITDLYLFIVFKGTLGNETDTAIAAGMKDLNEPQHFSIWNVTDRFYLDRVLRTAEEIRNTPALLARVDFDGDGAVNETGIGEPYIDPYNVTTYIALYPTTVTPTEYNAAYTPLPPGRYGRIIMLADMPEFYLQIHRESTTPPENSDIYLIYTGVTNQENNGTFQNTQVNTFRGITQHQWTAYGRYYPDAVGISTAPWPAPADTNPYPATIYP